MPETPEPPDKAAAIDVKRVQEQRAPIAQLLLVARLRARNRRDLARDSLERAAHVIFVTCKNWFSLGREPSVKPEAPATADAAELSPAPIPKGPDAHRHD